MTMTRKAAIGAMLFAVMIRVLGEDNLYPRKVHKDFYRDVEEYFKQAGFNNMSQVPNGEYSIAIDKYSYYTVVINQSGDESTPDNCQLNITRSELLYFGGLLHL